MKLSRYTFLFYCLLFLVSMVSNAQTISYGNINSAKNYLVSRGISEEEFATALKAKGYDVNNTQYSYILQNKSLIQNVVNELEASKKLKSLDSIPTVKNGNSIDSLNKSSSVIPGNPIPSNMVPKFVATPELATPKVETISSGIYGHDLFEKNQLANYINLKDVSPPNNYILGPGDKINVLIFGKSQADLLFELNAEGFIQPTSMPKLFLKGLTLKQAKEYLQNRFSSYYLFNAGQFAVTIQSARQINVNIFGEVVKSGIYNISGLNTIVNALGIAGGPNLYGSVRKIELIRNGQKILFDLYDFLENPSKQFNFFLQNNDVIYVPLSDKIVKLEGAVNRELRFELKSGEGISELIKFSGGLQPNALTEFVQVERIENNQSILLEYSMEELTNKNKSVSINQGDIIRFKKINAPSKDFVIANGAFIYPGKYDFESNKSLKLLIAKAKFLPETNLLYAFIYRDNFDSTKKTIPVDLKALLSTNNDVPLVKGDEVLVFDKSLITDAFKISVSGEVRSPFSKNFRFDDSIPLDNALELAGGLKSIASNLAYIFRNNPLTPKKTTYIPVDLNANNNFPLLPGDELLVLNKSDFEFEKGIRILGEVNTDYASRFDNSITLKDLFYLAKGKTLVADLQNIDVFRVVFNGNVLEREAIKLQLNDQYEVTNLSNFTLQPFDIVIVRKIQNSRFQDLVTINGEVKFPGPYLLKKDKYFFSDLINDAGGFTNFSDIDNIVLNRKNEGNIVFTALDALNHAGELSKDPILRVNDEITVGLINNTVRINLLGTKLLNELQNNLIITYQGKRSAKWYINNYAGGFEDAADKNSVSVISKSGKVSKTYKSFFIRKYPQLNPGDQITLKMKVPKDPKAINDKPFDWEKLSTKIISIFTALALIQAYIK